MKIHGIIVGTFCVAVLVLLSACDPKPTTNNAAKLVVPDLFVVDFETTKGDFQVAVYKEWAPAGAERFYELNREGFYNGVRFHRVIKGFMAQFGINGNPDVSDKWRKKPILDDPPNKNTNAKGTISFAKAGVNSRTTEVFINMSDNERLDGTGFVPFGKVIRGMEVVESLYSGYGELQPNGNGPDPAKIMVRGNDYLESSYPKLDFIKKATLK